MMNQNKNEPPVLDPALMPTERRRATLAEIEAAREIYTVSQYNGDDDIQVDDDALASEVDNGVWVQGWLFVRKEDLAEL